MAQKTAELRNSFSRGVLDPALWERTDLEHYYLALKGGENIIAIPQGGVKRRPGTLMQSRLRRRLAPVPLNASMITAHNGGTVANLLNQNPASLYTTNAVSGSPFVLLEVDFGTAVTVAFVDVIGFLCQANGAQRCLAVEYWTGSAWAPLPGSGDATLSPYRSIATTARTRRFGGAPGTSFSARNWRVTLWGSGATTYSDQLITGLGTVSLGGLRFWQETSQLSRQRLVPFAKSTSEVYQLVLTDRNIDVFKFGRFYASVPVAIGSEIVREVKFEQSLDTLIVFHQDVAMPWVQRQGAHDEWNLGSQTWANLPALSANTAFSGNQDEVQNLAFSGLLTAGDKFVFALGDTLTSVLTYSTPAQLVTDLSTAILALYSIAASGLNVVLVSASPVLISVSFVGSNGNRRWPPLSFLPMPGCQGACVTSVVQRGVNATGKIMDDTTGWPSCGVVHQSRLMLGGFRSAPSTWLMSRAGVFTDFTLTGSPQTADMGIQGTIDSDDVEEILHLYIGQRLHLFTTRGEWWSDNTTFDATKTTDVILATRYGAAQNVFPAFVQNGTLFVQDGGQNGAIANTVVRDFVYDWQINNYTSDPISLLGGQLLTDVAAMAHRAGVTTKDASLIFFVNSDGSLAIMTLLKSQDITAMTSGSTPGSFTDVAVDLLRYAWCIALRGGDYYLELFDDATYLDAAVSYTGPVASVTLPDHLSGQTVWAYLDGDVYGPLTPAGSLLALPVVATAVTVGFWAEIDVELLPWRPDPKKSVAWRKMVRVYRSELSLLQSGPLQLSANDGPFQDVPIRFFDGGPLPQNATGEEPGNDDFDVPMMQRLYSGYALIDGLKGWTRFGRVRLKQPVPAPFELRSIRYEIAYG